MEEHLIDLSLFRDALFADDAGLALWNLDTNEIVFEGAENGIFGRRILSAINVGNFALFEFIHEEDRDVVLDAVDAVKTALDEGDDAARKQSVSCNFVRSDGSDTWCDLRLIGRIDAKGQRNIMVLLRNDEEDHRRVEELQSQVGIDAMTGVCNKTRTRDLVERCLAEPGSKGALLIFDLDKFKSINDTFGHLMGDAVLSDMALSLKATFRTSDIVGRVGGDEFLAFMPGAIDPAIVEKRAEVVRSKLHRTFDYEGGSFTLTCSVGVAYAPADGTSYDELFEHADAALYYVKEHGRDGHTAFQEGMKMSELVTANIDSDDMRGITLNDHPVEFIFRMLFETRDAKMTASLLLELLGKHFNVQRTFVYHFLPGKSWTCFFDWHDPSVSPPYVAHEGVMTDYINMNYRRTPLGYFAELADSADAAPEMRPVLEERGIRAFLHTGIMDGDEKFGCVGMDDCEGAHAWTDREREVLKAFADILGGFLVRQANGTVETGSNVRLRDVIESVNRPIFITDPDDGSLMFANTRACEEFGVAADYSNADALPLGDKGFPIIWKDGREVTCHALS